MVNLAVVGSRGDRSRLSRGIARNGVKVVNLSSGVRESAVI